MTGLLACGLTVAAILAAGAALGVAVTSDSPIGILDPDPVVSPPPAVAGSLGLIPGGRPVRIPVAGALAGPLRAVAPAPTDLGAGCPASAWRLSVARASAQAAGAPAEILVALATDAPEACQGFAGALPLLLSVPGDAGTTQIVGRTAVPVRVAVLATPGLSVVQRGGLVAALPIAPLTGPAPSGYSVQARDGDRWVTLCTSLAAIECADPHATSGVTREYRVIATLGGWRRASAGVRWGARQW